MSYNKYRWYSSRNTKRLPKSTPLLTRIKHGDFDYSPYFEEAVSEREKSETIYNQVIQNARISDKNELEYEALNAARMKRIKSIKLEIEGGIEEENRINELRKELELEFGKDLWDNAMDTKNDIDDVLSLYYWYKKTLNMHNTPSEIAIKFGWKTTKRLRG